MRGDVDNSSFRYAMGRFATGVCVITTVAADKSPVGVTISAFTSLSLEPSLILFCLGRQSQSVEAFVVGGAFVVNLLTGSQVNLSERFASSVNDKFADLDYDAGEGGSPLLRDCLANLECSILRVDDGGDHIIIIGHVHRVIAGADAPPLIRYGGRYQTICQD